ncbi:MAG: FadR family transcriptional regulator [Planctomycetaceae bacterium]|nr:FadR family transcriptional regulator [Planctomycetaceae bacterium]
MSFADASSAATCEDPAERIRRLIFERGLSPGDRLPSVRDLSRLWGATLVEVRIALAQAKQVGLIDTRARSGVYVRDAAPNLPDAQADGLRVVDRHQLYLCQAREVLEVETAAAAAQHRTSHDLVAMRAALDEWLSINQHELHVEAIEADTRFHLAIADAAGNPVLTGLVQQCLRRQLMFECGLPITPAGHRRITQIHRDIYQAIEDRDVDAARDTMRAHMRHLTDCIRAMIDTSGSRPSTRPTRRR